VGGGSLSWAGKLEGNWIKDIFIFIANVIEHW
jgi:hypothetical protein